MEEDRLGEVELARDVLFSFLGDAVAKGRRDEDHCKGVAEEARRGEDVEGDKVELEGGGSGHGCDSGNFTRRRLT